MKTSYIYATVLTLVLLTSGGLVLAGGGFDDFGGTSGSSQGQTSVTSNTNAGTAGNTVGSANSGDTQIQDDSVMLETEGSALASTDKRVLVLGGAAVVLLAWLGYWFWKRNQTTPTV
ncbi:MAG TPA: hypothetical protein VJH63_03030 [Candidatus Paceibacterota bacterium]